MPDKNQFAKAEDQARKKLNLVGNLGLRGNPVETIIPEEGARKV